MELSEGCTQENDDGEITPQRLRDYLALGHEVRLLDVRQPWEYRLAHLHGAVLIPLPELPWRLHELDPARLVIVYCHHGIRSSDATAFLRSSGFTDVKNLQGGIDRWSVEVDPSVPRY